MIEHHLAKYSLQNQDLESARVISNSNQCKKENKLSFSIYLFIWYYIMNKVLFKIYIASLLADSLISSCFNYFLTQVISCQLHRVVLHRSQQTWFLLENKTRRSKYTYSFAPTNEKRILIMMIKQFLFSLHIFLMLFFFYKLNKVIRKFKIFQNIEEVPLLIAWTNFLMHVNVSLLN